MDCGRIRMDDGEQPDEELRALFEREQVHVSEQPFVHEVARRVAASRRRRTTMIFAAQAVAIGTLIAASPWLITGSTVLSAKLGSLFESTASALDSPYGFGAGLLCFAAAALVLRRRLFG
jgi:hypothetical protein